MDGLRGHPAVVTGAGGCRGDGAAICRVLAEEGVNVFFTLTFSLSFLLGAPCAFVGIFA
jgi:NAD(P)-dependent dehydrogenase (short-subunit alcohol dehydrogenase family)